jgi:hypothetical protein
MQFDQLNRRDFILLLGGAAISWPPVQRTNGSEDDADFRCSRS